MEYTKGNWKAEHIGNEGKYVIHTGDLSVPFAHTFPNRYRDPQVSSEEAEANAHLIAASPMLYEALKNAVIAMGAMYRLQDYSEDEVTHELSPFKAALAKAGGK